MNLDYEQVLIDKLKAARYDWLITRLLSLRFDGEIVETEDGNHCAYKVKDLYLLACDGCGDYVHYNHEDVTPMIDRMMKRKP